jgi:hypothetical protein
MRFSVEFRDLPYPLCRLGDDYLETTMRLAAVGMWWRFKEARLVGEAFDHPSHAAEFTMLRDPAAARTRVEAAVEWAIDQGADAVALPGSSIPKDGEGPPGWLVALSKRTTIVVETFATWGNTKRPSKPGKWVQTREGWVLAQGRVVSGPIKQGIVSGRDARGALLAQLADDIVSDARAVPLDGATGVVLLCGEVNVVAGGGPVPARGLRDRRLDAWWRDVKHSVVFNPTHTWMKPQGPRDKRAWLSKKGAVLCPMNAYDATEDWDASNRPGLIVRRGGVYSAHPIDLKSTKLSSGFATACGVVVDL